MSLFGKIQPKPTLDHYRETTDSFLLMLVNEMKENPNHDKITLLFKAAENRINADQQTDFAKTITDNIASNRSDNANWPETAEQAQGMLEKCLEKYKELYPAVEMPIFTITRNCKGIHAENYIYTREQLEKLDPDAVRMCDMTGFGEGAFSANDTYTVSILEDPMQLRDFLTGHDNFPSSSPENDDYIEILEAFYWETKKDCMYTGKPNPTMEQAIHQFKLSEKDLSGRAITNELALSTGNGYVEIHKTLDNEYDYSIYDRTFNLIDGGVIEDESLSFADVYRDLAEEFDFKRTHPIDINPEYLAEKVDYNDKCRVELARRGLSEALCKVAELTKNYPELFKVTYTPSSIKIAPFSQTSNPMATVVITGSNDEINLFFHEQVNSQYANKNVMTKAICSDIAERISDIGKLPMLCIKEQAVLSRLYDKDFYESINEGDGTVRNYELSEEAKVMIDRPLDPEEEKPQKKIKNDIEIGH